MENRKSKKISLTLCIFFGYFGAHKFYESNTKQGILYLCTFGLFGFGWIIDIFKIAKQPNTYLVSGNYQKLEDINTMEIAMQYPQDKTSAIKKLRELTGISLKEATRIMNKIYVYNGSAVKKPCPQCGGMNYHAITEDVMIRGGRIKDGVYYTPTTIQKSKFICDDCGRIFKP